MNNKINQREIRKGGEPPLRSEKPRPEPQPQQKPEPKKSSEKNK